MTDAKWIDLALAARQEGSGCPDDEALREWVEERQSQQVTEHVASCPRCCLEADEMRAFFAPIDASENSAAVRHVRARLDASLAAPSLPADWSPAAPVSLSGWRAARVRLQPWLAAAAMLVLAVGLAWLLPGWIDTSAPALPSMDGGAGPFRGASVATSLVPHGRVNTAPDLFQWAPSSPIAIEPGVGADGWEFRLESIDGTVLWSTVTHEARVRLPVDVVSREPYGTPLSDTGRNGFVQPCDEVFQDRADFVLDEVSTQQPDTAVDVEAHTAGRDDAVLHAGRRDAADREAVAPVDVGHRHRGADYAREKRDVGDLLHRPIFLDLGHQPLAGEYDARDAHALHVVRGQLPHLAFAPAEYIPDFCHGSS